MTTATIKYWVTDLSDTAQDMLINECATQLQDMGYNRHEVERFVEDLCNEKLGNLSELISVEMMEQLSDM